MKAKRYHEIMQLKAECQALADQKLTITPAAAQVRPVKGGLEDLGQATPGPWKATTNRYPDGLYNGRPYVYSSNHGYVAETFMNEEGEANARLIAACPDLVAALKRLVDCPDLNFDAMEDESVEAIAQARAALAAATGQE
jgi:hypothetical protein